MNKDETWGFVFLALIIGFIAGAICGTKQAEEAFKREAVLKNHATWVTNANGDAVFEWKPAK